MKKIILIFENEKQIDMKNDINLSVNMIIAFDDEFRDKNDLTYNLYKVENILYDMQKETYFVYLKNI